KMAGSADDRFIGIEEEFLGCRALVDAKLQPADAQRHTALWTISRLGFRVGVAAEFAKRAGCGKQRSRQDADLHGRNRALSAEGPKPRAGETIQLIANLSGALKSVAGLFRQAPLNDLDEAGIAAAFFQSG